MVRTLRCGASRHSAQQEPDPNAYIERFNRAYREEVLKAHIFSDLQQVREISAEWINIDNEERPHEALGTEPPAVFRAKIESMNSLRLPCLLGAGAYDRTNRAFV